MPQVTDRLSSRLWELDLTLAGQIRTPKKRRYKAKRQEIVRFVRREGSIERFSIRQTLPYCGYEVPHPPSQAQYTAVMKYFGECCETPFQASTMLSARDYAQAVAASFRYGPARGHLLALGTAAFILADEETRALVRSPHIASRTAGPVAVKRGGAHASCYQRVYRFASALIDDMRGDGADAFG